MTEGPLAPTGNLQLWLVDDDTVYWQGPLGAENQVRRELYGFAWHNADTTPTDHDLAERMLATTNRFIKSKPPQAPRAVPPVVIAGPPGPPGKDGERGSLWFSGIGAPTVMGNEKPGDKYLNTATGDVYTWV